MEIITHGGGEILYYVLNGVASIINSSDYADLIAITLAFGVIWIGSRAMFAMGSLKESASFFLGFLIFYQGLLLPKVTVLLTDKFGFPFLSKSFLPFFIVLAILYFECHFSN